MPTLSLSLITRRFNSVFIPKRLQPATHNQIQSNAVELLPVELWLYIASFIPKGDLRKLAGLNRIFYELVMNDLYHELNLINPNPRLLIFLLESLRDPTVAKRVRILKLWPGAVHDALNFPNNILGPRSHQSPYYRYRWIPTYTQWRSTPSISPTNLSFLPPPAKRQSLFLDTIVGLSHVTECHFEWYHYMEFKPLSRIVCDALWSAIGANLHTLTINVSADKIGDVIAPMLLPPITLHKLKTLRITFVEQFTVYDITGIQAISDYIVPLINIHAPILQHLQISNPSMVYTSYADLSKIFRSLGPFPRLETLSLLIRFNSLNLSEPSGLQRMLQENTTIRMLELRHTDQYSRERESQQDGYMRGNNHLLYGNMVLPHILELKLGLRMLGGVYNPGFPSIARMCCAITSLTLFDRSLPLAELNSALRAFSACLHLQSFSVPVQILTPEVLDLIAQKLPFIRKLEVAANAICGYINSPTKEQDILNFQEAMRHRKGIHYYTNWRLEDITIKCCVYEVGFCYMWACMRSVASVVPSIDTKHFSTIDYEPC
ncbi:hypothetical protein BDQ12DRAFT_263937 [Crucibulum laeve]|uniref:F-box domain-containing protein n=1 Tax=Crucibulum laeve TaxID=68775 RepID=A0A5C3LRS0_9AGAR|nr:hypothetical protein BDQ12DRAFT_263937 [Crucibulum laeve]